MRRCRARQRPGGVGPPRARLARPAPGTRRHLAELRADARGVEAYVEPPTAVTATRSSSSPATGSGPAGASPDARAVHALANELGIPVYDAAVVGYPARMRDWNARQKLEKRRAAEG